MKIINESLDKIFGEISIKMAPPDKNTIAKFKTEIDDYKVTIKGLSKIPLEIGSETISINTHEILFKSSKRGYGGRTVDDGGPKELSGVVFATVAKVVVKYVEQMKIIGHTNFALNCSVAGDNSKSSKRKIYQSLFAASSKFGFRKWKKELIAIPKELYEKIKNYGFQKENGQIVFDEELR